jgi:hypothetical protein
MRFKKGKSGNAKGRPSTPRSLIMTKRGGDIVLFDSDSLGQLPGSELAQLTTILGRLQPSSILEAA